VPIYTEYALGLTSPPTPLHLFSTPILPPMVSRSDKYSIVFDRGDGSMAEFQVLTEEEKNSLQSIVTSGGIVLKSRSVFIVTRSYEDANVFVEYSAIMIWPQNVGQFLQTNGQYFNIPILFRKLVTI
jgi:hypothetical protein